MKKLLTTLCISFLCASVAFAQAIRDIDETVVLHQDGSARVTQVWDVEAVDGTEFYLPFDHLGPLDITDLLVSERGVPFVPEGDAWDTGRTREAKRGRCGIVRKSGGVELCWGQGDYGDHVWTVSYTVKGLVMQMGDCAGLYFTFVNPGLVAPPEHVRVRLVNETGGPEWTSDNVKVWGFRNEGEIYVEDGAIRSESTAPFGYDSAMTVLVRFDDGLFAPAVLYDEPFEKVQELAFEGSDYPIKMTFWDVILAILAVVLALVFTPVGWAVIIALVLLYYLVSYYILGRKYKKSIFGKTRIEGWYHEVPVEGSLPAAYYALAEGSEMGASKYSTRLIGAYFLRWVFCGQIQVLPDPKRADRVNLSFEKAAHFVDDAENELYAMVREASGNNRILEADELEKWSKKSFKRISDIPARVKRQGLEWYICESLVVSGGHHLTPEGKEQARHVVEFKNYLEDFTLSKDRGVVEVALWEDYLVFAALFGIADKVAGQFKKLYPAEFSEFSQAVRVTPASFGTLLHVSNQVSAAAMQAASAAQISHSGGSGSSFRSSGGGGHTSFGGGGHSFGGSHGGGSR